MLTVLLLSSFPLLALSHNIHPLHYARQVNSVPPPPLPPSAVASASASASVATSASGSASGSSASITSSPSISLPPTFSVSFFSTNPSAVPLSDIVADALETVTPSSVALFTTCPPGTVPSSIPSAPPLPDISNFNPLSYPKLDVTPPTDSPQVQAWIQEVQNSGFVIPNYSPTNDSAACASNPDAVAQTERCWWTCQPCTRDTDVNSCPKPFVWGITSDDGPGPQTPELLQYLNQQDILNTFFLIGSRLDERPNIAQVEYCLGHAIGVHTWSHPPLTTLTNDQVIAELGWSRQIIKDVIGVTPNTMRPPYGDIDDRVRAISMAMGLRPVIWTRKNVTYTFDTNDWRIPGNSESSSGAAKSFINILNTASTLTTGMITLQHDLWSQTVDMSVGYFIPDALAYKPQAFTVQNVPQCLGLQPGDWYVETNDNSTNPPPSSGNVVVSNTTTSAPKPTTKSADTSLLHSIENKRALIATTLLIAFVGTVAGAGLIL